MLHARRATTGLLRLFWKLVSAMVPVIVPKLSMSDILYCKIKSPCVHSGAVVEAVSGATQATPIIMAAHSGSADTVQVLLDFKANIDAGMEWPFADALLMIFVLSYLSFSVAVSQ